MYELEEWVLIGESDVVPENQFPVSIGGYSFTKVQGTDKLKTKQVVFDADLKQVLSATDPTFSNAVMAVTHDFKTHTYTKTETDALIAANKPEYEDVLSNVVWRIEADGARFFFKPVRPVHTED